MRSAIARVTLKIIELLGCIACFVTKVITDLEARRVFLRNQKYSREWSLVHNVTWSKAGNTFANITYGGFSLITTLMLISRCIDANSRPSLIEKIFLTVGMLCFFAMGGLVLAAFDQVPWELHDNSIILGCLSFFVALVMLYDLSDPMARHVTDMTQTENDYSSSQQHRNQQQPQPQQQQPSPQQQQVITPANITETDLSSTNVQNAEMIQPSIAKETIQPSKPIKETVVQTQTESVQTVTEPKLNTEDIAENGNYRRGDTIDLVQYQHMPQQEQPVFERVLLPEKKRPTFNKISDQYKNAVVQTVNPDDYIIRESPSYRRDHVDSTMHYSQMPKYAAIQRHQEHQTQQPYPQYLDHSSSYAPPNPTMYKLSRNYEPNNYERPPPKHSDYERPPPKHNDYERPPPKHIIKTTTRSDELSRYRDAAPEHFQSQPMMVIRNYTQPLTSRTQPTSTAVHNLHDRRHHQINQSSDMYHRHGINGTRKSGAQMTQTNSRKNGCCGSTDDEIDFRKMNSAIRPGFVQTVAKLWDRRAVENSAEFNTIV